MASNPAVTPETQVAEDLIPPLDPALFHPSSTELAFLKAAISDDEDEIRARVEDVQKEAYYKHPYPCIRAYHHVSLMMSTNDIYPRIVQDGKANPNALLVDIGCCMGTDVRKLASDGFPASQILGCDLRPEFIALGHKLYADAATCPIHFFPADVFTIPMSTPLHAGPPSDIAIAQVINIADLVGRVNFIYTGALFHLWDESTQHALALRLARLLKRVPGAVIFGRHQGLPEAGIIDDHLKRTRYGHSTTSWIRLWQNVFEEIEGPEFAKTKVKVVAKLTSNDAAVTPGRIVHHVLWWSVEIVE